MTPKTGGLSRQNVLSKILSVLLTAVFITEIIPLLKPTLFDSIIAVGSIYIIANSLSKFFTGQSDWKILLSIALVVLADLFLLAYFPIQ